MTVQEITDKLYATYGSDSGILFGIKERGIVEAIVTFVCHQNDPKPEYKYPLTTDECIEDESF